MIRLLRLALLLALMVSLFAMGNTEGFNNEHESLTKKPQVLLYDWKEDAQYGNNINKIIQELDLSEFRCIIARSASQELPDGRIASKKRSPKF